MITKITYARPYNLGNYENERLEAEVAVEGGEWAAAFAQARDAVEAQHAAFAAERKAAQEAEYAASRARQAEREAQWAAERAARADERMLAHADESEDDRDWATEDDEDA